MALVRHGYKAVQVSQCQLLGSLNIGANRPDRTENRRRGDVFLVAVSLVTLFALKTVL
jgi:hypothetical protein